MNTINLLKNLCLIELIEEETRNGFIVPDKYKETPFGIVRGIGKGKTKRSGVVEPIPLKIGDKVIISENGGRRPLELDGKSYWLIDADNILATMGEK